MQYQNGESLVELILVLSLGLFIFAGAFKLLSIAKQELHYQLDKNALTQALLASEYELEAALSTSGVASCGKVGALLSYKNLSKDQAKRVRLAQGTSVQAFHIDEVQNWDLKKAGSGQAADNTDVLVLRRLSKEALLNRAVLKGDQSLNLPHFKIKAGSIVIISDCQHLIADKVIEAKGQTVELETPLYFSFKKASTVGVFQFEAYYIGKTLRKNREGKPILALYVQDTKGVRHELIPDVTEFRLQSFSHAIEAKMKAQSENEDVSERNAMLLTWQ